MRAPLFPLLDMARPHPPSAVPWFPRRIEDLDTVSQKTLDAGSDLESDHPGFNVRSR